MSVAASDTPNTTLAKPQQRKKMLLLLVLVVALAAVAYGVYWFIYDRHYEYTDDAYVDANIVQLTSQVAGTVVAIAANETDYVRAGEPLVRLDATNAQVALDEAEAQLAQTVREVSTVYADNSSLASAISQRRAQQVQASSDLASAQMDLQRRLKLVGSGAVSQEEVQHAQTALANARSQLAGATAQLNAAQDQLRANQVLTAGTDVRTQPKVLAAAVKVRQAWLDLKRGAILAPIDGYVGKRSVQLGQRIAIGAPLLTIVPLRQVWVSANFKEAQLRDMRIGQPVQLTSDAYGGKVDYRGHVIGMGAGTGAAFALLPAQNATGNWIKVVQRIPVRIGLDANQVDNYPLRVGMSMEATVNVADTHGAVLASAATPARISAQTAVYDTTDRSIDSLINRIISTNRISKSPTAG
ncbi:MAG: HlyD family efflux transporter periplasmic adaptor subunit [Pseudomonadota bacterium]